MTVVCCWLDSSYNRRRITAISDARASSSPTKTQIDRLNDNTTKLFRTVVNCYDLDNLDLETGAWKNPYFSTEIGLGFAGSCYEAMSIIALYQRCVSQLVADSKPASRATPKGLVNILLAIAQKWFCTHAWAEEVAVTFLLFGFSPLDGLPWAAEIRHAKGTGTTLTNVSWNLPEQETYIFGDVSAAVKKEMDDIRLSIQKHAKNLPKGTDSDSRFASSLELAKHQIGQKKFVESIVLREITNTFKETIGGVLQKIEVYPLEDNRAVVSYSKQDSTDILDALPPAGDALYFIPIAGAVGFGSQIGENSK